jgi:hypothetical protein
VRLGIGFPSCSTCSVVGLGFSQPTTCAIIVGIYHSHQLKKSSLKGLNIASCARCVSISIHQINVGHGIWCSLT